MEEVDEPRREVLGRLSNALGILREDFFVDVPHTSTTANAEECLRLWFKIATDDGRRQALEALRAIADTEGRSPPSKPDPVGANIMPAIMLQQAGPYCLPSHKLSGSR